MFEDIDFHSQKDNPYAIENLESEIEALEKGVEAKKFQLEKAEEELILALRIAGTKENNIYRHKQDLDYTQTRLQEKVEQLAMLMSKPTIDFNADQSVLDQYNTLVVNIDYNSDDSIKAAAEELSKLIANTLKDYLKSIDFKYTEGEMNILTESVKLHTHVDRPCYCSLGFAGYKKEKACIDLGSYSYRPEFLLRDNKLVFMWWDKPWDESAKKNTITLAVLVNH